MSEDITVQLFLLGGAIPLGIEAVKATDIWRRWAFGVLTGIFVVLGITWPYLKGIYPPFTKALAEIATNPQSWFLLFVLILILVAVTGRRKRSQNAIPADSADADITQSENVALEINSLKIMMQGLTRDLNENHKSHQSRLEQLQGYASGIDNRFAELKRDVDEKYAELKPWCQGNQTRTEQFYKNFARALRARDAETVIKEADGVISLLGTKLLNASSKDYPSEKEWMVDYYKWHSALKTVDHILSLWDENHRRILNIHATQLAETVLSPPESINSGTTVVPYRTLYLAQQSYANKSASILAHFATRANEF